MLAGLRGTLSSLVNAKYNAAKASQSLVFSATELVTIETEAGVPFQLRYCPALVKKLQKDGTTEGAKDKSKKPDPFDNPDEALLIAEAPEKHPTHLLVLNKYPVIPEHFILATKQNKQQTALLEKDDLEATYACLKSWEEGARKNALRRLFAFFNSGDHSGASQPHRHVQFLPVEGMSKGQETARWKLLIDLIQEQALLQDNGNSDPTSHPALPFVHYGQPVHPNVSASELHATYKGLYRAAEAAVRDYIQNNPGSLELHPTEGGSNPISYNLALTTSFMAICPRRKEGEMLHRSDGSEVGLVALNGTLLAGTLMVKGEDEWNMLRNSNTSLDDVLGAIGFPHSATKSKSEQNKL